MNETPAPIVLYEANPRDLVGKGLEGFFVGWPNPPSAMTLCDILKQEQSVVARDSDTTKVVGFVYAISDGVLTSYVPLL